MRHRKHAAPCGYVRPRPAAGERTVRASILLGIYSLAPRPLPPDNVAQRVMRGPVEDHCGHQPLMRRVLILRRVGQELIQPRRISHPSHYYRG
jgi:hypothetical protein